tara:strand:+ start:84 stop:506 length:423 start_codon:yes stop_codon:yes gene_type:complete
MKIEDLSTKNRKKPCKGCPFRRDNNLSGSTPGGSEPEVYLGQARGPFWLPCHQDKNYDGKNSNPTKVGQCAGAAIFRSNTDTNKIPKELVYLEKDTNLVFASPGEFLAHYKQIPLEIAEQSCTEPVLNFYMLRELRKINY